MRVHLYPNISFTDGPQILSYVEEPLPTKIYRLEKVESGVGGGGRKKISPAWPIAGQKLLDEEATRTNSRNVQAIPDNLQGS